MTEPYKDNKMIQECMARDFQMVAADQLLADTLDIMRSKNIEMVLVKDTDGSLGIFSERDLLTKINFKEITKEGLLSLKVRDVMTRNLKAVSPDESYMNVIRSMQAGRIEHLPVAEAGKIIGVVSLKSAMSYYEEKMEDLGLELFEKAQQISQKTLKLNAIMRLSEKLISNMETTELLAQITKTARELTRADTASVILLKEDAGEFVVIASEFSGQKIESGMIQPSLDGDRSITGWVIKNKQPLLLSGRPENDPRFKHIQWKGGIKCSINVPLVYKDSVKGTLNLNVVDSDYNFTKDDFETAISLANHVSVAIENSTLFKDLQESLIKYLRVANERMKTKNEQLRLAQEKIDGEIKTVAIVQQGLLPKTLPRGNTFDIAAIYSASTTVGGDYYDCIEMEDGRLLVAIADITGHGLSAAFIMTMVKILLMYLHQQKSSLSETVSIINNMLLRHVPISTFPSLIYGILDPKHMTFEYVNAGHEPIYLVNANTKRKEFYYAQSTLLGIGTESGFPVNTIYINKDDKLFFYTDGILEAINKNREPFGMERFIDIIERQAHRKSKEIIDEVMNSLKVFCEGEPFNDDITMLVISF
ncbi:MAG TPA: SpoIIE family protein phosphatase [Candidatus Omnitrophota bacterium]|nr:SpoIIE family protein phosphatase [Candidatus Omnitrophota bacterium]HPD84187.1 SpoIIE family protein phosphatase [Candidatus Omnitrophota bacterium]HRZ03043.1 SpoIIE family protein phosphatase [Candidatus Omnitrophota bacterium]